ncbi:hypothetical protein [Umezawaea sp. Da 62-37]|uniref:hypothetical protein n=1 Tax=Umezawaea sp. Da 62-37 TaxID=3075927 RepID=UPI0028F6D5CB|nr:hypothetical protein [Umezawaea sp. Da 62-37]WNV84574.1 hypothetical protein RM788_41475 [Umezawaea sp. Da 62-37]
MADLRSAARTDITASTPARVLARFVDAGSAHVALHTATDTSATDTSVSGLDLPTGLLTVADTAGPRLADAELCHLLNA